MGKNEQVLVKKFEGIKTFFHNEYFSSNRQLVKKNGVTYFFRSDDLKKLKDYIHRIRKEKGKNFQSHMFETHSFIIGFLEEFVAKKETHALISLKKKFSGNKEDDKKHRTNTKIRPPPPKTKPLNKKKDVNTKPYISKDCYKMEYKNRPLRENQVYSMYKITGCGISDLGVAFEWKYKVSRICGKEIKEFYDIKSIGIMYNDDENKVKCSSRFLEYNLDLQTIEF